MVIQHTYSTSKQSLVKVNNVVGSLHDAWYDAVTL